MAVSFTTDTYITYPNATFLDNKVAYVFIARVRIDTLNASQQMIFRHRLGSTGDQISLRKDSTTNLWKASVTIGSTTVGKESSSAAVAGTVYDLMMAWTLGDSNGLRLWIDGVEDGVGNSTTGQLAALNTSGGTLSVGCRNGGFDDFLGTIERFVCYTDLGATDELALHFFEGGWPQQIPQYGTPTLGRIINPKNIFEGGYIDPPTGGSGPPAPNDWTEYPFHYPHPTSGSSWTINIDGLTNGVVYEFMAHAVSSGGLESANSEVVEGTPSAPLPVITSLTAPWRRTRRFSKYKANQQ